MAHTGVEPKPPWREIPSAVRDAVAAALGCPIQRAMRVWGGYSPSPTFRLRLGDGRRVFLKAAGPEENEFASAAFRREERIYAGLSDVIGAWAPAVLGMFHHGAWRLLLLEDIGPKSAPPWKPSTLRGVARSLAAFHQSTADAALPAWLPTPGQYLRQFSATWDGLLRNDQLAKVAGLAGQRSVDATRWLEGAAPRLAELSRPLADSKPPHVLLHGDLRSDNLRWRDGRLRLFDWPHAGIGPAEFDIAAFAQSVTAEGGPPPEPVISWYAEQAPLREDLLDAAVASIAGYFAAVAWQEEIPGLPRVRDFQQAQLAVTLPWAARRVGLPSPDWVGSLSELRGAQEPISCS